jgi:3-oxoadipate enol-lactonase
VKIETNGTEIHCDVSGDPDAPWLVCLHSLATGGWVWDAQLPALDAEFHVLRPDFRGHGRTAPTAPPYSLDLLVRDTIGLLDALEIDHASFLGLSLGAIVTMGIALDHPDRVERAVIADVRADAPDPYVQLWETTIATARADGIARVVENSLQRWFSPTFHQSSPHVVEHVRKLAEQTSLDGLIGVARAVQGLAYLPRLGEITVPTLFVVGGLDPAAPPDVMRDMAARVPASTFVEIAGAGHLTSIEAPEAFLSAVFPFLTNDR